MSESLTTSLFTGVSRLQACAAFLGQRLDLRTFEDAERLAANPLTVGVGRAGVAVLLRYGAVVLFGLDKEQQQGFIDSIQHLVSEPLKQRETDTVDLALTRETLEGVQHGCIQLQQFDLQRLQVVAEALGKSVVLAYYETSLARSFDRIEPLAASLSGRQRLGLRGKDLLQHIGDTLLIESRMTGRVEAAEKPELLWDFPQFERLYLRLESEYELVERSQALERKLSLLSRVAETLLDILQNRRTLRVEWYIVILIVVEILITVAEKLFGI